MEKGSDLQIFFEMSLRRLYSAESQMYDNLEKAIDLAAADELCEGLIRHREETGKQIDRIKKIFQLLRLDLHKTTIGEAEGLLDKSKEMVKGLIKLSFTEKSKAMEGIIEEGKEMVSHFHNSEILDYIIASGERAVEMGEIAAYNVLCSVAERCGYTDVLALLRESLEEEKRAYELLTQFASRELAAQY
jgi:ferritin-like metal-binding protein YciE